MIGMGLFPTLHPALSGDSQLDLFDQVVEFNKLARMVYKRFSVTDIDLRRRIGSFNVVSSETAIPLQASDLLCYRMVKRIAARIRTNDFPEIGSWDRGLGADETLRVKWLPREKLWRVV